ncbi:hypothetical protein DERF_014213 [Dermatophagoides farinae]|uniref:Uncharacterized protein n=1 Tax=Dermatophagoides farinae TaxID=6954 RepID=A0A922KYS2_DERFA|nr:hypothetical protein DERF_014213 [Dermatophagoides farinae]
MLRHFFQRECHFTFYYLALIFCFVFVLNISESWKYNFNMNKTCTKQSECADENQSMDKYHYYCDLKLSQCICVGSSYLQCQQRNHATLNDSENNNQKTLWDNGLKDFVRRMPMLPISIILISMFISICIVLQLFAKARFRNTHRSIFANPQKLELAKAQERRLSQLSQLSGQQQANNNLACSGSENQRIYSLSHYKYPRLSLPQAPIPTSSSSSSIRRSARNSLGSTIVPTIIGPTLATATPTSANSFNTLSSSSSSQNHLSVKQKQERRNNNLTTSESLSIVF